MDRLIHRGDAARVTRVEELCHYAVALAKVVAPKQAVASASALLEQLLL